MGLSVFGIPLSPKKLKQAWHIPLYSNAIYLITGNSLGPLAGFAFWAVAARFYSVKDVGLASAAIAVMGMLGSISHLGLNFGLIKFLPGSGKNAVPMINSCLTLSSLASILASLIFITGIGIWSPDLVFLRQNVINFIAFIMFVISTALTAIIDNTFVAERRSGFVTARSAFFNFFKLILVVLFIQIFNSNGILNSWGAALTLSVVFGLIFLPRVHRGYSPRPTFNRQVLGGLIRFSIINNISNLLWITPALTLPIVVLSYAGPEANAYFYIAWATFSALSQIPISISTSLFAEGSHRERELINNAWRSVRMVLVILTPIAMLVLVFADKLLILFGNNYADNAAGLLRILTASLFPMALNQVYFGILRVEGKLRELISLVSSISILTLIIGYILLGPLGILGPGIAWLACQTGVAFWIVIVRGKGKPALSQLIKKFS